MLDSVLIVHTTVKVMKGPLVYQLYFYLIINGLTIEGRS